MKRGMITRGPLSEVFCLAANAVVTDFRNPPVGCTILKHWEDEDAKSKEEAVPADSL
jgi:hypothetical protein